MIFVFGSISLYSFWPKTNTNNDRDIYICIHRTNIKLLFDLGTNRIVKNAIRPSLVRVLDGSHDFELNGKNRPVLNKMLKSNCHK